MPKLRRLADLPEEEIEKLKTKSEDASTSAVEDSQTPSQLDISGLEEPCVSMTPSLFEGLEAHGKSLSFLRNVYGVTEEDEQRQREQQEQQEQEQEQQQQQQEEQQQPVRKSPSPPTSQPTPAPDTPHPAAPDDSGDEFEDEDNASTLLYNFKWKCRAAQDRHNTRQRELVQKQKKCKKNIKKLANQIATLQRQLVEEQSELRGAENEMKKSIQKSDKLKKLYVKIKCI